MKRLLLVISVLAMLVLPVAATNLNFQNPGDMNSILLSPWCDSGATACGVTSLSFVESTTGGNNYYNVSGNKGAAARILVLAVNPSPSVETYAAATLVGVQSSSVASVTLLDANRNLMWRADTGGAPGAGRYEMKIVGGTATAYANGVPYSVNNTMTINPSYIGFGAAVGLTDANTYGRWDDYVYGASENKYVLGLPETNAFVVLDDVTSDGSDGLYNVTSGTQVDANYMYGTWSRGNLSTPLTNESIQLVNYQTGAVYATNYTGTAYTGTVKINIKTSLIDANAPGGWYALTIPGTSAYSNQILKRSNGASVTWDRDTYSTGDTGTVITVVADGGYWDTTTYDYKLGVMDIYGVFHGANTTVTTQTQTITHDWAETDNPGVYYAILFATKDDGTQYIFGLDYAELDSVFSLSGYVNDAQTGLTLSGANLNFTQGATIVDTTSGIDGNYSATGFATGAPLVVNATATNYVQYVYSFTPLAAKSVSMNVSLVPASPTLSGLGIGGVARDVIYGRPIQDAFVTVTNTTTAEEYIKTTSMTGWYLCDEGASCFLQTKTPYSVWGNKTGYANSTVYSAVTA